MNKYRNIVLAILDAIIINISYIVGLLLRFDGQVPPRYMSYYLKYAVVVTIIQILILFIFKMYKVMWRYATFEDYLKAGVYTAIASVGSSLFLILVKSTLPRSSFLIALVFEVILILIVRMIARTQTDKKSAVDQTIEGQVNSMVIGAGAAGVLVVREMLNHPEMKSKPVCIIDDDNTKINKSISSVPVVGNTSDIVKKAHEYNVEEIVLAIPTIDSERKKQILNECEKLNAKVKIMPGYYEFIDSKVDLKDLRDVQIEDLLGRDQVVLDKEILNEFLNDKVVMVTGAGGSIGSELCRQILKYKPKKLVMIDIYENTTYDIQNEILRNDPDAPIDVIIESIRNFDRMNAIFGIHKPDVVFHAAAHKHVPLMEHSPQAAVLNNVFGTKNIIDCCDIHNVKKFVLISTDKAVNPTSVMGCTKRICELLVQSKNQISKTEYVAVRFGNVLGSNGSVIPLFKKQIQEGGPVTVTHKDIIRYFMTIPEACQLVMQAGAMAEGGEIFVLDMGDPVKIVDLAKKLIKLSGLELDKDIKIEFTGLRPGEKLYEETLIEANNISKTKYDMIFVEEPVVHDIDKLSNDLVDLKKTTEQNSKLVIVNQLQKIVPNYTPDVEHQ